jgi:plasmid maintenance system antidote protein VapI
MKAKRKQRKEELAEALVFPVTLTPTQKKEAARQLAAARVKSQQEMSEKDRLVLQLHQLKFQLEEYIEAKQYDPEKHFGYFLRQYIVIVNIKRRAFAKNISIDETMLSQFINKHRTPPDYIWIRLELHSGNLIPATYWFRLTEKEKEYQLQTDKKLRQREKKFVHGLALSSK